MKIYNRYIASSLLKTVSVITLTLTGIIWLTQSLRFIDLIVNKGLDVSTFLYLSILLIPSLLMIILPVALLISVLMVYNKLISDSEMIVFKSAGLSRMKLTKPAIIVAVFISLFGYLISLYILPASYREFKDMQAFIRNNHASVLLQEGVFSTPIKGLTVYIESRGKQGLLEGILVHDSRNPDRPVTMMAQEGRLVKTDTGPRFELVNGNRQEIDKEHGNLSVLYFDSYPLDLSVYTDAGKRNWRTPEERYINELFSPGDVDKKTSDKFLAEGHHRIIWPLYSFTLMLIAIAALFSGQFNRRGQWKRILSATIISVILVVIGFITKSVTASNPPLAIFMYLNLIVPTAAGLYIIATNRIISNFPVVSNLYTKAAEQVKALRSHARGKS